MTVSQESIDVALPAAGGPAGQGERVWGPWGTIGLSAMVFSVFVLLQVFVVVCFLALGVLYEPGFDIDGFFEGVEFNGLLLSVATAVTSVLATGLVLGLVKLRKGVTVRGYLGLVPVDGRTLFVWVVAILALAMAADGVSTLFERPVVPEFMARSYATAGVLPLYWLAVVLLGPIFEEVFFRGFMLAGLARSRLGGPGAIVVTSLAWAAIHVQYDLYGIATVFAMGLLLGAARLRTGSLYLAIAMHAAVNFVATLQVALPS
jgi:membrane protease YdiL (CAAX protease family)